MSRKERECLKTFERVTKGELKLGEAAEILGKSYRQCRRKYKRYRKEGDRGLVHAGRGRPSNRRIEPGTKEKIIEAYKEKYMGFGPTLAAEKLNKRGYQVDHETLRRWLIAEGILEKRRKRPGHRSWRQRRGHFGELVQMDGSPHDWFERRRDECCLMNMVDDATSQTLSNFEEEETTVGAMKLLWRWIDKYGIPAALYTDRKNVYVPDEKSAERAALRGEQCLTQFGRACKELGIRIIEAHSPQAKGRVERSNGTYQDRLIKELRLEGISSIEKANELLHGGFIDELNNKFSVEPRESSNYHRSSKGYDLKAIFCIEEQRSVTNDWIVRFENNFYQLESRSSRPPAVNRVKVRRYLDGQLHINYRGRDIQYVQLAQRPVPSRPDNPPVQRHKKARTGPAPNHPWRKSYKRGSTVSTGRKNRPSPNIP